MAKGVPIITSRNLLHLKGHEGYQAEAIDDSGRFILGSGLTEAEAVRVVRGRLGARNAFLKLPAKEQLRILTVKDMTPQAISDAVKLLAEIILNEDT